MDNYYFYFVKIAYRFLLIFSIVCGSAGLYAQNEHRQVRPLNQYIAGYSTSKTFTQRDTLVYHQLNIRFQQEVLKRGQLQLDSLITFGHEAIDECISLNYTEGLIKVYLGFAAGFIDKIEIDSAKYYAQLAIAKSTSIQDSQLLAKSKLAYGWALVYDKSDYEGAIEYAHGAYAIAKELRDTGLLIGVGSKLTRIYFLKTDIPEAFKTCSELTKLCQIRKDTNALVYNYYMLGSIYAYAGLYDKQMGTVYKTLKLKNFRNDTSFLYTIYNTASNGYLFKHQYDSVLYYSRLNLAFCQSMKRMPYCLENIAKVFLETNQLDSAQYYYTQIMEYHQAHGTYIDTYLYLNLGRIQYAYGNYKDALAYFKRAEAEISKPSLTTQAEIYKWLYTYYDFHEDAKKALYYHKQYTIWSDSIATDQFVKSLMFFEDEELQEQYQILQHEKQQLSKESELFIARTEKLRAEANALYGGIALGIFLGWFGFKRFQKHRILRNKQELLKERLRISRELHDEVGATLSGIAMYSHVAVEQLKNSKIPDVEQSLSFMQKSAGEMINKLSDIVWLINPEQDTIVELLGRLGEYGKQMTRVRNMQLRIDLPPDLSGKHIPLEARRNIYLFCKEAINNAVKYSNGTTLVLQVKSAGSQLIFSITDDGNGFDESIVRQGNGLVNMRKRAEEMGAIFHMDTRANQGTKLELQYKIIQ